MGGFDDCAHRRTCYTTSAMVGPTFPRNPRRLGLDREPELFDPVPDLISIDAEELTRLRLIAAGALERLHEQLPLDFVEADPVLRQLEFGWRDRPRERREVARLQPFVLDE